MTGPCQSGADGRLLIHVSDLSAAVAGLRRKSIGAGSRAAGSLRDLILDHACRPHGGRRGRVSDDPDAPVLRLVMSFARFVPFSPEFVMALARSLGRPSRSCLSSAAVIRRRARDLGTVPHVARESIVGLGQRREAEKSHERAENNGLSHCLSSGVSVPAGYSARTPGTMRAGR